MLLVYIGLTVFIVWTKKVAINSRVYALSSPEDDDLKRAISKDVCSLRLAGFKKSSWSVAGKFRQVSGQKILLYEHRSHVPCSSIKLSKLPFTFTKMPVTVLECTEQDHNHDVFLPFFCDNLGLLLKYTQLLQATTTSTTNRQIIQTRMQELNNFMNGGATTNQRFHTGGHPNRKGAEMRENDWTKRLVLAMQDHGLKARYTAEESFGAILAGVFTTVDQYLPKCFPLHGTIGDAVFASTSVVTDEDSEFIFENGKKSEELGAYPDKLGELFGGMQLLLTIMLIKNLVGNKTMGSSIKVNGLYVNKWLGSIKCSLTMPIITAASDARAVELKIDDYNSFVPNGAVLCYHIKALSTLQ